MCKEEIINNMKADFDMVEEELRKYIKIILSEYKNNINIDVYNTLNNKELLKWNDNNTVSFIVRENVLYLPKVSYQIFDELSKLPNYRIRSRVYNYDNYLNTDTTYYQYINEVIECGLLPINYFLESLLHEAMHICGSSGATPLEEGINELKTRELAQKYHINIAAFGYSKEVEIAKYLQELIGKEIMDSLTFIPKNEKIDFIKEFVGVRQADTYDYISKSMSDKVGKYMFDTNDPFEKAQIYSKINYNNELDYIKNIMENNRCGVIK